MIACMRSATSIRASLLRLSLVPLACSLLACSESSSDDDRRSVSSSSGNNGGRDAGLTEAGVDPNDGRDSEPASCFAACQNTAFTCQAKGASSTTITEAELVIGGSGCTGTLKTSGGTTVALKLDCAERTVCIGGAPGTTPTDCAPGTFSAFSYAYTPKDDVLTVCTRN
jgi:hypothetical protein